MSVVFLILLFVLGACFGSFLCCTARRLRLKEQGKKPLGSRSVCLHCKHQLTWYDNLPLISWLALKGRCRHCRAKIGPAEFLSELFSALTFLLLGLSFLPILPTTTTLSTTALFTTACSTTTLSTTTASTPLYSTILTLPELLASAPAFTAPLLITLFFLTLTLLFLAIYDGLYGELPAIALTISIICAIMFLTLRAWASFSVGALSLGNLILPLLLSLLVLPGLYFVLYKLGRGKWVGDGDWLLALAIALALADPLLALLTLFFANFLACLYALPFILKSPKPTKPTTNSTKAHNSTTTNSVKISNSTKTANSTPSPSPLTLKLHFGPFLVAAFILVFAFADFFQNLL